MKHIALILLTALLALASCSKDSKSGIQGDWTVNSIQVQEITSNTDSGWKGQMALGAVFYQGETLSIEKSAIRPCPSADNQLEHYDEYKGTVKYTYSSGKLAIAEIQYYQTSATADGASVSIITYPAMNLNVEITDGRMSLSGMVEEKDNLGNVSKRNNVKVVLNRSK